MQKAKNLYLLTIVAYLAFSCAQQGVPTGGEKDTEPPQLLAANPPNRQIHFKGNEVILTFNEYIQLNNPREQIVIVPPLDRKKLEVTAKKNRVYIRFNQSLQDSTTYTLNFREAIQDITERNPARNLKLAFSTGPVIDTLLIKGTVHHLLTDAPAENYTVALAPLSDTLDIFKHKPMYFTYTDKAGNFQLDNLKKGSYIIYAFADQNKNLTIDSQSEPFGFRATPVALTNENLEQHLLVYKLDMRPLKLVSARPVGNQFIIRFNKGYNTLQLQTADSSRTIYYTNPEPTAISIYNTWNIADSLGVRVICLDSISNKIDTTLYVKFSAQRLSPDKFTINIEHVIYYTANKTLLAKLRFSKPVVHLNPDSICIYADSAQVIHFNKDDFTWNNTRTEATIYKALQYPLRFEKKSLERRNLKSQTKTETPEKTKPDYTTLYNHLILKRNAFISAEKDTLNTSTQAIKELKPEDVGILLYETETTHPVVAELYNKNKIVIKSQGNKGRFTNILRDTYRLRAYIDTNHNGTWDWGNYYQKQEPEPVWHYYDKDTRDIPIKANWEIGPLWIRPVNHVYKPAKP
jgi:hypothetical protein